MINIAPATKYFKIKSFEFKGGHTTTTSQNMRNKENQRIITKRDLNRSIVPQQSLLPKSKQNPIIGSTTYYTPIEVNYKTLSLLRTTFENLVLVGIISSDKIVFDTILNQNLENQRY